MDKFIAPLALTVLLPAVAASTQALSDHQGSVQDQQRAVSEALRSGGIRAAAAITGHYVGTVSAEPENNVDSLTQLVQWHDVIVVGRITSSAGWLTADGETVVTDYRVAVERVLKGHPADFITVSILGGRVSFEDGSSATLTSTMPAPRDGERYLLFLRPSWYPASDAQRLAAAGPIYAPQHLALSVYHLDSRNRVISRARPDHPLQQALGGIPEAEVIDAIVTLTGAREP
jgi:hypothetical protein